jgi:4-amino-4-deoxy-L-arabinose transferase-like glycosyltransferase
MNHGLGYRLTPDSPPTAFRAPGWPFYLLLLYRVAGESYPVAYVSFCLLGAASCVLTYYLARELLPDWWAWVAAWLAAVYLPHIYWATQFSSENLFIPLLALGLGLYLRAGRGGSLWLLAAAGLVLGYATLVRPFALLLPLVGVLMLGRWRGGRVLAAGLLYGLPFVAVLAPWTARNYQVFGPVVLLTTNGGSTFYGSNNDKVYGERRSLGYWVSTTELPGRDLIDAQPDEVTHDKMEWRLGLEWVKNNPGKVPLLLVYKFARLWYLPEYGAGLRILRVVSYVPFLALFAAGAWRCLRERELWTWPWLVLHVMLATTVLTALIFSGQPRFRDANAPLLMVYAAAGLGLWRRRERSTPAA